MKRRVDQKLDSLEKYVPFINYLLQLDKVKYTKFINIRQWILERKRHPMNVLEKIEQCIITQYRNLFLVDGKVPKHIMDIFNTHAQSEAKCYRVNLCSDDEDNDDNTSSVGIVDDDDDDDVIIVSTPPRPQKQNTLEVTSSVNSKKSDGQKGAITTAPKSIEETICIDSDDDDNDNNDLSTTLTSEDSFYNEEKLFKRRADFENEDNVTLEQQLAVVDKIDNLLNKESDIDEGSYEDSEELIYIGTQIKEVPKQQQKEADQDVKKDVPGLESHKHIPSDKVNNKVFKQPKEAELQPEVTSKEVLEVPKTYEIQNGHPTNKMLNDKHNNEVQSSAQVRTVMASSVIDINEQNLESMDIENLKKIYEDLTKECQIDVAKLLENINLSPSTSTNENMPNNSLNTSSGINNAFQQQNQSRFPKYDNSTDIHPPYPQLKTIEIQRTNMLSAPGFPTIQPFKVNLKDPRIRKYLEKNKILQPITPTTVALDPNSRIAPNVNGITKNIELPKHAPITYGEYRRLKAEQERKLEELKRAEKARRAEEARRIEEAGIAEEARRVEEARRADEVRRAEEARRVEEIARAEKARRVEEQKPEEMRAAAEKTKIERNENDLKNASFNNGLSITETQCSTLNENRLSIPNGDTIVKQIPNLKDDILKTIGEQLLEDERFLKFLGRKQNKSTTTDDDDDQSQNIRSINKIICSYADKENKSAATMTETEEHKNFNTNQTTYATTLPTKPSLEIAHNKTQIDTQTDLKSMILQTILPYGDKILDVLRQNVAASDAKSSTKTASTTKPEQREAESTTSTLLDSNDNQQNLTATTEAETVITNTELSAKTKNLKRQRKSNKESTARSRTFKRIRTISSSSSSSSSSVVTPTCAATTASPASPTGSTAGIVPPFKTISKIQQQPILMNEPILKLRRLSAETIRKYTERAVKEPTPSMSSSSSKHSKTINIQLVEDITKSKKTAHHLIETKPAKLNVKYKNVDSRMTDQNTTFCVLCKSKPSDLTNHYKRVHKTETYVARLSAKTLKNLETNTRFVQILTKTTNSNFKKYSLKCAFCNDEIEDRFINFYKHFSTHTGEYAFQCGVCKLEKPFEFDIQSHKCHSKTCRNARIKLLYQYPPNVLVIYLYACKICNFVQLNEANTFKHLRDHHDKRQDDSNFICKYILAAINDEEICDEGEAENSAADLDKKFEFPKDDDDILVRNEALSEEILQQQQENVSRNDQNKNCGTEELVHTFNNMLQTRHAVKADSVAPTNSSAAMVTLPISSNAANHTYKPKLEAGDSTLLNVVAGSEESMDSNILKNIHDAHRKAVATASTTYKHITPLSAMDSSSLPLTNTTIAGTCNPLPYIKTECSDTMLMLPRPIKQEFCVNSKMLLFNSTHKSYRHYPNGIFYFGLFKCMATDCLFSTDSRLAILQHLNEHRKSQWAPEGYLLCAYCQLDAELCNTPEMLIEHIQRNHQNAHYQCSICCYRAITPNHVLAHLQHIHQQQEKVVVYNCALDSISDMSVPANIFELLNDNVEPFVCPFKDCFQHFNSVTFMQKHLIETHNLHKKSEYFSNLDNYACIYCIRKMCNFETVKLHLIESHPDQQPYVCERTLLPGTEDDLPENLTVTFVPLPEVPIENIQQVVVKQELDMNSSHDLQINHDTTHAYEAQEFYGTTTISTDADTTNRIESEIKPNIDQLLATAEECVKVSLLKLTKSTGIAPDLLYHCPQPTCGGFFSSYDLWYKHMSVRHCCIISVCPHCPNDKKEELPLADFKMHFQQHCCHLYGCFYCGETFSNELASRDHVTLAHNDINPTTTHALQIEQVPLYFRHTFNVVMKSEGQQEQKDRYCFLLALQNVIQKRCAYIEKLYYDSLKTQWIVPFTALWLENFPSFKNNDSIKRKCFCQNCTFQTYDNDVFYEHLRTSHRIGDSKFACAKCDFRVSCENWEPIIEHIKMHLLNIYICCVCSYYHHDRRKIFEHLQNEHRYRDVPIVTVIRSSECVQISIAIVFAELRKTFSTIKTCFVCNEHSSTCQTYAKHLKKSHYITLQYFCEICNAPLQLVECDNHFIDQHSNTPIRIGCQIATNNQLSIDTIKPLQLQIKTCANEPPFSYQKFNADSYNKNSNSIVKTEPADNIEFVDNNADGDDDDVEMVNDDDIVIANDALKSSLEQQQQNMNVIRCVNVRNLQSHSPAQQTEVQQLQQTKVQQLQQMQLSQPVQQAKSLPHSIPQLLSPTSNFITTATSNFVTSPNSGLPRVAIQSHDPNFTGTCHLRPVKILIRPNTANPLEVLTNPPNANCHFQNIEQL